MFRHFTIPTSTQQHKTHRVSTFYITTTNKIQLIIPDWNQHPNSVKKSPYREKLSGGPSESRTVPKPLQKPFSCTVPSPSHFLIHATCPVGLKILHIIFHKISGPKHKLWANNKISVRSDTVHVRVKFCVYYVYHMFQHTIGIAQLANSFHHAHYRL
jgi:hypothetical protein